MKQRLAGPGAAPEGKHGSFSLEKAWHGVHWVLTGTVEPDGSLLGGAVLGGTEIGDDFSGYGHALSLIHISEPTRPY